MKRYILKRFAESRIGRSLLHSWHKLIHLHNSPKEIAMGFAIGAFIGVFPTFGLGGIMAVGICALFRLNYISAIVGSVIIMNPVSTPLFWALSAALGSLIFSADAQLVKEAIRNGSVFGSIGKITYIYLTGNIIVSSAVAVISYFLVKSLVQKRRKHHEGTH